MSKLKKLISEIHRRSLWQVLLIYVGAAWACFELIATVADTMGLPGWLSGLAIALFLLGLPFVVATAFVREETAPAAPATEAVSAEAEHQAAVQRRRFLTWRNAGLSFLVAFALWGVVATGWLLFGERASPEEVGARKSIAVLPFANLSDNPDNEYFSDGITDEIITHLSKIAGLRVTSRTSSMQYKHTDKGLLQIAEELGVSAILEGGVQRAGGRVRINAQLVAAESDEHLWAETYDRELADVFAVQSDVAERIAATLRVTLTPAEREQLERRPTKNLEAYALFLRGNAYSGRSWRCEDFRAALEMYQRAVTLDREFSLAHARLSIMHSRLYHYACDRTPERLSLAKAAVDRALEVTPALPEAHEALGLYCYWGYLDYDCALEHLNIARSARPNSASIITAIAFVRRRQGQMAEAATLLEEALELDPRSANLAQEIALTYEIMRDYAEAESFYDLTIALDPDRPGVLPFKALMYMRWGRLDAARASLGRRPQGAPYSFEPMRLAVLGRDYQSALDGLSGSPDWDRSGWTPGRRTPKALLYAGIYDFAGQSELAEVYYDSARAILEPLVAEESDSPALHSALGITYAGLGWGVEAIREGELALALQPVSKEALRGTNWVEDLAQIYTMVGQHDAAIDRLEFLLSVPGALSVALLRLDPTWDPLRDHPRFRALLEKYE